MERNRKKRLVAAGLIVVAVVTGSLWALGSRETAALQQEGNDMKMVVRVVVQIDQAQVDDFVSYISNEALTIRQMDGAERYELFADPNRSDRFMLYQEWSTPAAFEAYQQSDVLRESFRVLGPMMTGPPESQYFRAEPTVEG